MWKVGLGRHVAGVHSLVIEPHLSIMGSFVARKKVADMTCSSQLSSRGERVETPQTYNELIDTDDVHLEAMHDTLMQTETHAHTCTGVNDIVGDQGW